MRKHGPQEYATLTASGLDPTLTGIRNALTQEGDAGLFGSIESTWNANGRGPAGDAAAIGATMREINVIGESDPRRAIKLDKALLAQSAACPELSEEALQNLREHAHGMLDGSKAKASHAFGPKPRDTKADAAFANDALLFADNVARTRHPGLIEGTNGPFTAGTRDKLAKGGHYASTTKSAPTP